MIPDNILCEDFHGSVGEEAVFNALRQLPDPYVVFHSLHWNRKENRGRIIWGESDFCIFHPRKGLLVIEVKSGGIRYTNGKWVQINTVTNQEYSMKDPMIQAERSKYTFTDLLESDDPHRHSYWIEVAVWFPSVSNNDMIGMMPPAYNRGGNVLSKNDLSDPVKSIESVFRFYNMNDDPSFQTSDRIRVIGILSPVFDAIPGMISEMTEQDYYFNRMTKEQSYLLDYLEEQNVAAIQGGAGTGKTMLAIDKARRLSANDDVLFLCFNRYLQDYLRETYSDSMPRVYFANLQLLVCKQTHVPDAGGDEGITRYLSMYDQYEWTWKHIIIDEGQDFKEEHIDLLSIIASVQGGCFYIFYDKNQLVQQRQAPRWINSLECRLVLSINCRNTRNIATTSGKSIYLDNIKMRINLDGQKPCFYLAQTQKELLQCLSGIIRGYTDHGLKQKQIVILTVKTEETSLLKNVSTIGSYHLTNQRNKNGILFTSARKFKGLEADVVLIVDIDISTFSDDEARRVFYVGTSRAKHYLDLISVLNDEQLIEFSEKLSGKITNNSKISIASSLKVKFAPVIHSIRQNTGAL